MSHFPRHGDKVNDIRRLPYANGFVVRVVYDDGPDEVVVRFDNGIEVYSYEDFRSRWTDDYGGCFILSNPDKSSAEAVAELLRILFP